MEPLTQMGLFKQLGKQLSNQLSLPFFDLWSSEDNRALTSSQQQDSAGARKPQDENRPTAYPESFKTKPNKQQAPTPTTLTKPDPARPNVRKVIGHEQQLIEFHLRRGKRRTIGFLIDDRGVTVSAPKWVGLAEIDGAVLEKSQWISRKLVEWRKHQSRRLAEQPTWADGGSVKYLGVALTLRIRPDITGIVHQDSELLVGLPSQVEATRIQDTVQAWLQTRARALFAQRLERLAMLTGKAPKRWALSSARTRWGSCTSEGTIRLNWRLMHFPLDVIDYVIAHELAHLSEMNHSHKFWDKVAQIVPDYELAKSKLTGVTDDM
jgi:predicted metal-dependent hydrolase